MDLRQTISQKQKNHRTCKKHRQSMQKIGLVLNKVHVWQASCCDGGFDTCTVPWWPRAWQYLLSSMQTCESAHGVYVLEVFFSSQTNLNHAGSQVENVLTPFRGVTVATSLNDNHLVFQGLPTGDHFTSMFWSAPGRILFHYQR